MKPPAGRAPMSRRFSSAVFSAAFLAGVLSFAGSVTGPAQATDGRAAAVGTAAAASPSGCWMVASDGGIFAFGDAKFDGSTGAIKPNRPISGMAPTPTGAGYWLTADDGGIFSFGDAAFFGAAPSRPAAGTRTVAAMVPSPTGAGYWQAASSGELLAFGDAPALGSVSHLTRPIVGLAALPRPGRAGAPSSTPGAAPTTPPSGPGTPPGTAPPSTTPAKTFSSTAIPSWGTPADAAKAGYSQLVVAVAESGNRAFASGEFTGLVDQNGAGVNATPYLLELDPTTGQPIPASTFTATANPDGPLLALLGAPQQHPLYVAGKFNSIGGPTAPRLAAPNLPPGALDPPFNPPDANASHPAPR